MSQFQILKPDRNHHSQIVELIREFAEFEKLSDWCAVTENDLNRAIFGPEAFVQALAAFAGETCVGYALFFPVFKSFRGERSIFLEDLYVSPEMRGKGLGLAMLREVGRAAKAQGFVRMDWQALKWNEPAVNFYKKLGAETDDENLDFRLRGENFEKLAS
jgi:GNAT superfamily N-acetyltransferase